MTSAKPGVAWGEYSITGRKQFGLVSTLSEAQSRNENGVTEIDALEFYLENHPRPGRRVGTEGTEKGEQLFDEIGCSTCHVPNWKLIDGSDHRAFDLRVELNDQDEFTSVKLNKIEGGETVIDGIYSDFRYHDLGERFREYSWVGKRLFARTRFRTPALWGVGSASEFGHDGESLTLEAVIRRHGGEAQAASLAFERASSSDRAAVIEFLKSMVLFPWGNAIASACNKG